MIKNLDEIKEILDSHKNELKEKFNQLIIDVFETDKDEILLEMDNDYTDI